MDIDLKSNKTPIIVFRPSTVRRLELFLDKEHKFDASNKNLSNFIGVAELAGFKLEEIKKLKNTSDLLEAWPRIWKKRGLALPTVGDLWGILKDLKREDVIYAIAQNIGDDITVYEQTDVEGELLGTDATDPSFLQDSVSELYARVNEPEGSFDDQSQIRETTGSKRRKPRLYGACRFANSKARNADFKGLNSGRENLYGGHDNNETTSFITTNPSPSNSNSEHVEMDENTSNNCTRMTWKDFQAVWRIFMMCFVGRCIVFSLMLTIVPYSVSSLGFKFASAKTAQAMFLGGTFLVPFFGGIVADEWTGGFVSIFTASLLSFIGLCLLLASSLCSSGSLGSDNHMKYIDSSHLFISALVLVAVGGGVLLPHNLSFGVQQVLPERNLSLESYILWFIWFLKAAELLFATAMTYIIREAGFSMAFSFMLILLGLASILFLHGKSTFVHHSSQAGIFDSFFASIAARIVKRRSWSLPHVQKEQVARTARLVAAVKAVIRIFPVLPLMSLYCIIRLMIIFFQVKQTPRLDLATYGAWTLPEPNIISYFICILVLIPVLDRLIYPYLHRKRRSPSLTQRLVLGLVLMLAATLCTGVLEILRKDDMIKNGYIERNASGTLVNVSKITRAAQIPQFTLFGAGEIMSLEPGLTYTYSEAPTSMKGIFLGLFGIAIFVGHLLLVFYSLFLGLWKTNDETDWYPEDPNKGHMEYAMFLVVGFICLYLMFFAVYRSRCCRKLRHRRIDELKSER